MFSFRWTNVSVFDSQVFGQALQAKQKLIMLFWPILGHFCYSVVTLVTFSSNHSKFEKNPRNTNKIQPKKMKINLEKIQESKN